MKSLYFIIFILSMYSFTFAQNPGSIIYINEFTTGSIPNDWETTNDATSSGTHDWVSGVRDMPTGADFLNDAVIFDDYAAGNTGLHDRRHLRMTYPVDVSGYGNVKIGYEYALQENAGAGKLIVLIGYPANWYTFQTYTSSTDPTYVEYDLESFISAHSIPRNDIRVGFIYDDENSGQNWGAGIGKVKFIGYPTAPAVNDQCVNAIDVTTDLLASAHNFRDRKDTNGSNQNLGANPQDGVCGTYESDGIWYKFTPSTDGDLTVTASPLYWDCELLIYSGSCNNFTCVDGVDNVANNSSENLTVSLVANTDYYINIARWSNVVENYGGVLSTYMEWTPGATIVKGTGIEGFKMYPNPSNNTLTFSANKSIKSIVIVNVLGQKMLTVYPNSETFRYDITSFTAGSYFVRIQIGEQFATYNLLKR